MEHLLRSRSNWTLSHIFYGTLNAHRFLQTIFILSFALTISKGVCVEKIFSAIDIRKLDLTQGFFLASLLDFCELFIYIFIYIGVRRMSLFDDEALYSRRAAKIYLWWILLSSLHSIISSFIKISESHLSFTPLICAFFIAVLLFSLLVGKCRLDREDENERFGEYQAEKRSIALINPQTFKHDIATMREDVYQAMTELEQNNESWIPSVPNRVLELPPHGDLLWPWSVLGLTPPVTENEIFTAYTNVILCCRNAHDDAGMIAAYQALCNLRKRGFTR